MAVDTETGDATETTTQDDLRFAAASVAGGTVGTTLMLVLFAAVNALGGPRIETFSAVADLAGVGGGFVPGFVLFFGAGAVAWPLMYATLGPYLPGTTRIQQGLVFAGALWLGFVTAFGGRYVGGGVVLFLVFSLLSHVVYGVTLGGVAGRLRGQHEVPELEV